MNQVKDVNVAPSPVSHVSAGKERLLKLYERPVVTWKACAVVAFLVILMTDSSVDASSQPDLADEREFFSQLNLELPALADVRKAVEAEDWAAAKVAWARHLSERTSPTWIWSRRDKDKIMAFLKTHGDGLERSVDRADRVLRREFRFQGIPRTLDKDIVWWSKDFEFQWINVLHRHGYWLDLGRAYWQTGDEKYAEDWVSMLLDWIEDNPVQFGKGPNPRDRKGQPWRKLETGGRTGVWIQAMEFFMDSPAFDAEAKYQFTRSLRDHALRLVETSQSFRPGNWHQVGVTGLFNLGVMFPEFKEAGAWREMGLKHLRMVMEKSVYPDGAQSELTPGYHYWMTLSFLNVQLLAQKNGLDLADFAERHEKMFEFLMQVTKPDHRYVALGDAGQRDVAGIMGIGALTYNRPDMRYLAADDFNPGWIWQFPPEKILNYPKLKSVEPALRSHMLPHARYGVMRTGWQTEDRFLLFDCAPRGGNHCHDDRLQVVLYSGRDLLIDRGAYSYDEPLHHQYFKKSQAHSVVLINEKDQPLGANPEVLSWNIGDNVEFASAIIRGKQGVAHQRSVMFVKPDYWVVVDHLTGKGEPTLTRLFQFPDVSVGHDRQAAYTKYPDGDNLWVGSADASRLEMRAGHLARGKNKTIPSPVAAFVSQGPLPASFGTVLVPFADQDDIPEVERLPSDNPDIVTLRVRFKDGRTDWIAIAPKVTEFKGPHTGRGIALCARTKAGRTTVNLIQPKPLPKQGQ